MARFFFLLIFFGTGFSALTLQVVWQRILTFHAGIDIYSVVTITAAYMAGLGLGTLLGGVLADRLRPRACIAGFTLACAGTGGFGLISIQLLYHVYFALVPRGIGGVGAFLLHFLLLMIPTSLMGATLPFLSRALVRTVEDLASFVGALYGANTLGAAVGAAVSGWWMIGTFGFSSTLRVASAIYLLCAAGCAAWLWRDRGTSPGPEPAAEGPPVDRPLGAWILLYGLTGSVALSLEVVWFRVLDTLLIATSYTWGHLLFFYLSCFAGGVLIGSRLTSRVRDRKGAFLWTQYAVGLSCALTLAVFMHYPAQWFPLDRTMAILKEGRPLTAGFRIGSGLSWWTYAIAPLMVLGVPSILMGMGFPFVQGVICRRRETLGRGLGMLLASNIAGNVAGAVCTGFILVHYLGTPRTLQILVLTLGALGTVQAFRRWRMAGAAAAFAAVALAAAMLPAHSRFWARVHGLDESAIRVEEDRSSVSALVRHDGQRYSVRVNGSFHSWIPYGDVHSLLGLFPALLHPAPAEALVVGLGSGDTAYSVSLVPAVRRVRCVELSGSQIALLRKHAADPAFWQVRDLLRSDKLEIRVGDGREYLLGTDLRFDLIQIDAIVPVTAYSGNLYSVEFFQLIRDRLRTGGIFCQWTPTDRIRNGILSVFPYVLDFNWFMLAGDAPLDFDPRVLERRLSEVRLGEAYGDSQAAVLRVRLLDQRPARRNWGTLLTGLPGDAVNRDLFPRDEYFLNR